MDDTCAECGHLVDHHGPGGCERIGLDGLCPCTAHPDHYDPSDD